MTKASKQDVEMLKKLVVEFKDELDALGVKVDKLDSRVAVLEAGVGGWKLTGEFRFDSRTTDLENSSIYGVSNKWDQNTTRVRLHFLKRISDGVSFYGRLHGTAGNSPAWTRAYVDIALPWDMNLRAGRQSIDWEDQIYWVPFGTWQTDGLLTDRDGLEAFYLTKNFSMGSFGMYISRADKGTQSSTWVWDPLKEEMVEKFSNPQNDEHWEMAARVAFNFNEQFGLTLGYQKVDFEYGDNVDFGTWYVEPKVNFTENFILKGAYYGQDTEGSTKNGGVDFSDPKAWRAVFEVKQEALKFTSLWLEYNEIDAGFVTPNKAAFDFIAVMSEYEPLYGNYAVGGFKQIQNDTTIWRIGAHQKWSDKWDTFLHYAKFDIDGTTEAGFNADADNYSIGFNYHYTPAVTFSLAYDKFEADDPKYDDHMIHFRTRVVF